MNREFPVFSVVVPVYNVEKYIKQCIDSVIKQTYTHIELILVDDGSSDGCPDICDKYAESDSRICVIHQENGGLVEARRVGTAAAHGDYIVFLDSDDWLEASYLEVFSRAVREHAPDVICCGYHLAYDTGEKTPQPLNLEYGLYDKEKIKRTVFPFLIEDEHGRYFPPMLWAKAYKTELYRQNQQVSGLVSVGEDHACTKPCIYYAEQMYVLEECLYNYRQNPASMTKKPKAYIWEGPRAIGQHFEDRIDMTEGDLQAQVYRNVVHNVFNVAVSQFNREEKYSVIKKDILENIGDPYYQRAIEHCEYRGNWKGTLARSALKHRLILLMWLFCKIGK